MAQRQVTVTSDNLTLLLSSAQNFNFIYILIFIKIFLFELLKPDFKKQKSGHSQSSNIFCPSSFLNKLILLLYFYEKTYFSDLWQISLFNEHFLYLCFVSMLNGNKILVNCEFPYQSLFILTTPAFDYLRRKGFIQLTVLKLIQGGLVLSPWLQCVAGS